MNIFEEYDGIFGNADTQYLNRTLQEIFELAASIRKQLGKQGYLIDRYLSCILEGASKTALYMAADRGFMKTSELRQICRDVMDGRDTSRDHSLYEEVKEHIETHPLLYQEKVTRSDIYFTAMSGSFLEYAVKGYCKQQKDVMRGVFDIVYQNDLFRKISHLLGDEYQMERLNLILRQRFLGVTLVSAYVQGLTDSLLGSLISRDGETSRQVFQLILDEIAD